MTETKKTRSYWHANLIVVSILLAIWFLAGFVISIFCIEYFNSFKIGTLGLGFWFAQQGSIFVFVVLVFTYAILMDKIDRKYEVGDRS